MRFIAVLFFLFLSLHSYFVFAQVGTAPTPACTGNALLAKCDTNPSTWANNCAANGWAVRFQSDISGCRTEGYTSTRCYSSCSCEAPYVFQSSVVNGIGSSGCVLPEPEEPETCPNGLPKVNGQCPVCPGGFNSDGTCKDDSTSSAASSAASSDNASSTPTSSPNSAAASSVANSTSGGDGGGDNGSGGGGNDNGGNNNGGGSASSAASASSKAAGSASSAGSSGAGQCDPTAKNYLACIGSQKMDGGETAWVPNSGYGNWLPVNENSPCVNKYQDASGQWWCAAPSNNGSGTGSSSGTGTSSGAGSSAAGQCDSTSKDYLQCISSGNGSSSGANSSATSSSSANASSSGTFSSLGEKGEFDGEASEKKHDELVEELEQKIEDIKADIAGQFGGEVTGSGTIQDFCKNIRGNEVCFGMKKFEEYLEPISAAIFLVACVISFAIVLRG